MYLVAMDQRTREDIAAATAAHAELGPGYDHAIAEGLIERIGDEIDKRVDARIGRETAGTPSTRAEPATPATRQAYWKGLAAGTVLASISMVVVAANVGNINPSRLLVAAITLWAVLFAAYVISKRARG